MGLTGTVVEATIDLHPIETSLLKVDSDRVPDLDTLLALLLEGGRTHRYSVAWVDFLAKGRSLGRSVLSQGEFATVEDLPKRDRRGREPLAYAPIGALPAPPYVPHGVLNRLSVAAFNEFWYRKAPRAGAARSSPSPSSTPLDMVEGWNRIYGPAASSSGSAWCRSGPRTCCARSSRPCPATAPPASWRCSSTSARPTPGRCRSPGPGWTLALDVPTSDPDLGPLLDRLDERVLEAGGRLYLAKDSRMQPEMLPAMYPRLDEWRAVRDRMDPDRRLSSDLARRLDLLG